MSETTWYKTYKYGSERIVPVQVTKSTDKCVWVMWFGKERRRSIVSDGECFFKTWQAAKDYLVDDAAAKVKYAEFDLQRARTELGMIKSLKAPE